MFLFFFLGDKKTYVPLGDYSIWKSKIPMGDKLNKGGKESYKKGQKQSDVLAYEWYRLQTLNLKRKLITSNL